MKWGPMILSLLVGAGAMAAFALWLIGHTKP